MPTTLSEAQDAVAQANPETMPSLKEGYRYDVLASNDGGVPQRWALIYSEHRRPQAQRTVNKGWRTQSEKEARPLRSCVG